MWRIKHLIFSIIFIAFLGIGCIQQSILQITDVKQLEITSPTDEVSRGGSSLCSDIESYLPDTNHLDHRPMRYLRVNVHFMNSSDSTKNYNGARGRKYARELIDEATKNLEQNRKMSLPTGNSTPVYPVRYRYVLSSSQGYEQDSAVYFHYDDDLFSFVSRGKNRNNYSRDVIRTYGVGLDSIINLFIMPHHPDSILSETYDVTSAGIALGSGVKLSGIFETRKSARSFKGLVNHEIGHVLGLRHTWNTNDGCDDTPKNPNCWNTTDDPPCDTMASNNLMDYNAHQHAWSPCQIGMINRAMSRESGRVRKMLVEKWCSLDPEQNILIEDSIVWNGSRDLNGNLTIGPTGSLIIHCRVSMPPESEINVLPGAKLVLRDARLHNACGREWKGINIHSRGKLAGTVLYEGSSILENVPSAESVLPSDVE